MAGWPWCRGPACPLGPHPCINPPSPHASPLDPSKHGHPAYCHTSPVRTGGAPPGHLVQAPRWGEERLRPGRDEAPPGLAPVSFSPTLEPPWARSPPLPKGTRAPAVLLRPGLWAAGLWFAGTWGPREVWQTRRVSPLRPAACSGANMYPTATRAGRDFQAPAQSHTTKGKGLARGHPAGQVARESVQPCLPERPAQPRKGEGGRSPRGRSWTRVPPHRAVTSHLEPLTESGQTGNNTDDDVRISAQRNNGRLTEGLQNPARRVEGPSRTI